MYIILSNKTTNDGTSAFWTGTDFSFEYDSARVYASLETATTVAHDCNGSVVRA